MRIGLTGSHGLIGSALASALVESGHEVTAIERQGASERRGTSVQQMQPNDGASVPFFDPDGGEGDLRALEGYDALIHLAGASIGEHRWDAQVRSRIYASRVYGTRSLVEALKTLEQPPATLLFASASGIYGDRGSTTLTEESEPGKGFLAKVVADWESEARLGESIAKRVVLLRTGLVLDAKGGLLGRLLPLFKLGLGGRLATGEQYMSWITLTDEVRAIQYCLDHETVRGPVNLVAPNPVTNREFTKVLAGVLGRPAIFTVPAPALELVLGKEMARELALVSQRITPNVLEAAGFTFSSTQLEEAMKGLIAATR
ncbi:TIGR01777 family oxidoreductase [Ferrimicrobium sp.]|uniref:TIGR01777 family oxidoreductase n=1 Tax=Ferrimicrobium sp. TaxID=2926050 RepID=UPI0026213848|nr:TIGR01777 family oxidoreductase [Ferrimicrobium sp.]